MARPLPVRDQSATQPFRILRFFFLVNAGDGARPLGFVNDPRTNLVRSTHTTEILTMVGDVLVLATLKPTHSLCRSREATATPN
jgi:hypothetical protein